MSTDPGPPLHESLEPIRFLLGSWRGTGVGSYPTIDTFSYTEEVTFGHVGKPFLAYGQRTRHAETNLPLHAETGYWRAVGADGTGIEVVLSHPTGLLESLVGSFEASAGGGLFQLRCETVTRTPTAVEVEVTERRFEVDGDRLNYRVAMAAVGLPLTHHLEATLNRA